MKNQLAIVGAFLLVASAFSQTPIDVTESTLKVSAMSEEVFYFGFAEGDQLIIENKKIFIARAGIYKFRFSNSAIGGRICKFKIQRIPSSSLTAHFNTSVYWRTQYDTTYSVIQQRYLVSADTIITNPVDQITKISSQMAVNGNTNKSLVDFELPENTVAWSYYIGVGTEGKSAYEASKDKFVSSSAATISKIPGYGTMAALAIYGLNTFSKVQGRDNVKYWFITDWLNVQQFNSGGTFYQYKQGDVINEAAQMKSPLTGKVYLVLMNDNVVDPIEVIVKVTAVQLKEVWAVRTVNQPQVTANQIAYLKN